MNLTISTLYLAVRSMQGELKRFEELASDPTLDDETVEEHGEYVLALQKALCELGTEYDAARLEYPHYPPFNDM